MKPNTLDSILIRLSRFEMFAEDAKKEILDLVSQEIQRNRHGFGLTVAEGEQLARRVKVALL